jgi:hypothetical protein
MFKRAAAILFALAAIAGAQQQTQSHVFNVVPSAAGTPGGATAGYVSFLNKQNTFHVDLVAPDSGMTGNLPFSLPAQDGLANWCLTTDGFKHLPFWRVPLVPGLPAYQYWAAAVRALA